MTDETGDADREMLLQVHAALSALSRRQRRLVALHGTADQVFRGQRAALGYPSDATARAACREAIALFLVQLRVQGLGKGASRDRRIGGGAARSQFSVVATALPGPALPALHWKPPCEP